MRLLLVGFAFMLGLALAATDGCAGQANVYIQLPSDFPGTVDLTGFPSPTCPSGCSVSGSCDSNGCVCDCSQAVPSASPSSQPQQSSSSSSLSPGASVSASPAPGGTSSSPTVSVAPGSSTSSTALSTASPTSPPSASLSTGATASVSPSALATSSLTPSPTSSATAGSSFSVTPSVTSAVTGTPTASSGTTATPSLTRSQSSSATPSVTPTRSPSATTSATSSVTSAPSSSPGASVTGTPSNSPSNSATASLTPSSTSPPSPSGTPSASSTGTVTSSGTATKTASVSASPSPGPSVSGTGSQTGAPSNSPTSTPSSTRTASNTASPSGTGTPSRPVSPSGTGTPTRTPSPVAPSASATSQPLINPNGPFTRVITIPKATANPTTVQTNCPSTTGTSISSVTLSASPVANSFTVAAGTTVYVPAGRWPATGTYGRITVAGRLVFMDANIQLYAMGIWVQSGGSLLAGSSTCRLEGPITMEFSDGVNIDGAGFAGRKGIYAEAGSTVRLYGHEYHYTWTRLAASLTAGSTTMQLQEAVNWQPGQRILIAPTILMDEYQNQYEIRTIQSISGFTLTVTAPVTYHHYGGIEYQAEVALLDRNIVVQGDSGSDASTMGAHMLMRTTDVQIGGVRCHRCGQTNVLARYPMHFHMAGDAPNGLFTDNVVEHSYYRAYVVHSTNLATVTRNVAYDIVGHAYYLSEDGTESGCMVSYNFAAFVHVLGQFASGAVQTGDRFNEDSVAIQPSDHAASCFYITNPDNTVIGNAACGGWAGFSIVGMWETLSQIPGYNPSKINIREFRGNTVHSTGYTWSSGCGVYVGGRLWRDAGTSKLVYDSGRWGGPSNEFNIRDTRNTDGTQAIMIFQDLRVSLAKLGFNDWGERQEIYRYEVADVGRSAVVFGDAYIENMWVTGRSSNPQLNTMKVPCNYNGGNCQNIGVWVGMFLPGVGQQGFQYYDISVKVIISTVTFENFQKLSPAPSQKQDDNVIILAMTHSDQFKPYGISAIKNVTYINVDPDLIIGYSDTNGDNGCNCKTGASRQFNVVDWDGTLYPASGFTRTLFGSNEDYWKLPKHTCQKHPYWGTWYCDQKDTLIAGVNIIGAGLTGSCSSNPGGVQDPQLGSVVHFGATNSNAALWITGCPGILLFTQGADNLGMYLRFNSGPTAVMEIQHDFIPGGNSVIIAMPYPSGTTFTSVVVYKDWSSTMVTMVSKTSRILLRDDTSGMPVYFWDSTNNILYLKLVDPERTGLADYYNRGGAKLWYQFGAELFGWKSSKVVVTATLGGGSVDNSDAKIPAAL